MIKWLNGLSTSSNNLLDQENSVSIFWGFHLQNSWHLLVIWLDAVLRPDVTIEANFFTLNCSFSLLNTTPFSLALSIRLTKLSSCCFSVDPYTNMSSAIPVTPLRRENAVSSCFWNISYETTSPNGSQSIKTESHKWGTKRNEIWAFFIEGNVPISLPSANKGNKFGLT